MPKPERIPVAQPKLGRLNISNELLGNRAALDRAWDQDGYWYFKGVLDEQVIRAMRAVWIGHLQAQGLIDPSVNENRYNGAADSRNAAAAGARALPEALSRISAFNERNLHTMLTESPSINATLKEILGDDPFWLPIAEYRANPPGEDPAKSRFIYPHQDGFYSRDMPMKICWIPVDYVDADVGGCAWLGGAHRGPILHDLSNPPLFPIPPSVLAGDGWLSADFGPGDIVIFHLNTPHSGLTNVSKDRFRMTMDIRVTEASGPVPTIGSLLSLTQEKVTLRNNKTGAEETYTINSGTFVRSTDGKKREGADIPQTFKMGEQIIVNSLDGRNATLVRSIH